MRRMADLLLLVGAVTASLVAQVAGWAVRAHGADDSVRVSQGGTVEAVVGPLRDLDSHCPFEPPATVDAWTRRAAALRDQVRVSLGLWPLPALPPVAPQIRGRIVLDGYSVEKVTFESLPGLVVTGNLYRPDPLPQGRTVPAVLCPHGHWPNGRFQDVPAKEVAAALANGGERFESAARNPIQARCVQLARMGCVVFQWDMLGYCDSTQISLERVHRFAAQDPATEVTADGWLLFSPLAEAHCQSVMGLQALNTQRSVDFVLSLPEVDEGRIGITGASGGGTQSFIAAAIDPRIAVAFPAVMVGTGMQGGCTCENACGLRVGTGNVELAALIAPRPLGLTAADDWTRTMPQDGFPQLQRVYAMIGAADRTMLEAALQFGHNYNVVGRTAMYGWMNRHFALGLRTPVLERDFSRLGQDQLTVWDHDHPAPAGGLDFERRLLRKFRDLIAAELDRLVAAGDADRYRHVVGTGWRVMLGLTAADILPAAETPAGDEMWQLASPSEGTWVVKRAPVVPAATSGKAAVTITCTPPNGAPPARYAVALAGQSWDREGAWVSADIQPLVANPRLAAPYTYCYNLPIAARRARQLAATLAWLRARHPGAQVEISGQGEAAGLAAAGVFCAVCSEPDRAAGLRLAIDPAGFRFASAASIRDAHFLPGSARFLDLPGLVGCLPVATAISGTDVAEFARFAPLTTALGGRIEVDAGDGSP
ncbi:MAG: acetylxylan esterase [Planctomycetia bacterium]